MKQTYQSGCQKRKEKKKKSLESETAQCSKSLNAWLTDSNAQTQRDGEESHSACLAIAASLEVESEVTEAATAEEATSYALKTISEIIPGSFSENAQSDLTLKRPIQYLCRPALCPDIYNPVCAFSLCSGLRTFPSSCELSNYNLCNSGRFTILFRGPCERFINCKRVTFGSLYIDQPLAPVYELPISRV